MHDELGQISRAMGQSLLCAVIIRNNLAHGLRFTQDNSQPIQLLLLAHGFCLIVECFGLALGLISQGLRLLL